MRWQVFLVTMRNDLVMIDAYDVSVSVGCIAEIPAVHMYNSRIQCNAKHQKTLYKIVYSYMTSFT